MFKRVALLLVVPLALAAVAMFLDASGSVAQSSPCAPVAGTLASTANFSNLTTHGTISGDLEGTTFFQGDPSSLTPVTANTSPALSPTEHYTGDLTITTKHGLLKTRSVGVFEFVPNGLGTQFDRILGDQSTGKFAGTTGRLYFNFQLDGTGTMFTNTYTGQICS